VVGWDWRALRRVRRDRSECERHQAANGSAPAVGQCAPTGRRHLTKSDATDPAGASTDRSNRRRRLLAAFRKRAGLACESAKVCVDVQSIPRRGIRTQSSPSFASPSLPAIYPEQLARIVRNWEGGHELIVARWGMLGPPAYGGQADHQHPEPPKSALAWAVGGSSAKIAASSQLPASANMRIRNRVRRQPGSP
jgi:hypothetical protein